MYQHRKLIMGNIYMPVIQVSSRRKPKWIGLKTCKIHDSPFVKKQLTKLVNEEDLESSGQEPEAYMGAVRMYWILPSATEKHTNCQKSQASIW